MKFVNNIKTFNLANLSNFHCAVGYSVVCDCGSSLAFGYLKHFSAALCKQHYPRCTCFVKCIISMFYIWFIFVYGKALVKWPLSK